MLKDLEKKLKDTASLPGLPEGWVWTNVEQLIQEPLCNGICTKGTNDPPGVRALRLNAMTDRGFDYSEIRYLPLGENDVADVWIETSDFFVSRANGSIHLVGRGTLAQNPPQPTIFPDTMIRLRFANQIRQTNWISTIWPSHLIRLQVERKVKTTAGIYKIAQPQVAQIYFPLPPLAEQARIVAEVERRLSVVEELDLWTLDALWWLFQRGDVLPNGAPPKAVGVPASLPGSIPSVTAAISFGLERHLHDFMFDNWDRLDIGREWTIYATPEDPEAGYEYPCAVGRIDILAKHRSQKKWLVVELKRGDTSDSVVGQALRYMGWVKQRLAEAGDEVHGLIIAYQGDDALQYAVSSVPNLSFQVYEVEFRLKTPVHPTAC